MDLPKTPLSNSALLNRIKQISWFHSIPLRPGITTYGAKNEAALAAEEQAILGGLDLRGRSVLDVEARNGHFSFAARRRGAARVLATNGLAWTHPRYGGREAFELVRDELGLEVEALTIDPARITPDIGVFDIVLFLGAFDHLPDPIDALQRVRGVTGQVLLIEAREDLADRTQPGMLFHPSQPADDALAHRWSPNPALMLHLLGLLGFARILYRPAPQVPGARTARGLYAGLTPEANPAIAAGLATEWRNLDATGVIPTLAAEAKG